MRTTKAALIVNPVAGASGAEPIEDVRARLEPTLAVTATRDDIGFFACKTLQVRATPPQQVLVDGEPVGTTPITISCWPASLRMIAPASTDGGTPPDAKLIGLPHLELERKS